MKQSVLILHQDSRISELIKRAILPEFGEFEIVFADSIEKFQIQIRAVKPAFIVSDALLHNICCLSLINNVREFLPDVVFIVFGDRCKFPCCQECLISGPDYFVDCPADFPAIFKLLKHLPAHPGAKPRQIKMPEISTCEFPRYLISHPDLMHKNKFLG